MTKASPFIDAMNAGEFSPRMDSRVNFDRYASAVSRANNLIALPQGGLTRRPGTRHVAAAKNSTSSASHVYGFQPSSGVPYMLEFSNLALRIYRNQTQLTAPNITASVSNGTFASNITGWDDRSTGTGSISWTATGGARMALVGTSGGYGWAEQDIDPGAGANLEHVVKFTVSGNLGSTITVQVGTSSLASNLFLGTGFGIGEHMISFTPSAIFYLQFIMKDAGSAFIDDVSLVDNAAIELISPYPTAVLSELDLVQVNDVCYIFHDDYRPYKIERRGDKSWSIVKVFWEDGPWLGINPEIDLAEVNLVKNPAFEGGMQDWTPAGFVEYDGEQSVVFFKSTSGTAATLRQAITTGSTASVHILHFQVVGSSQVSLSVGTTSGGVDIVAAADYSAGWYTISFTPGASPFYINFARGSSVDSSSVPGVGGAFCYNERHNLLQPSALTGSITLEGLGDFKPFQSTDVGRLVRLEWPGREPGYGTITTVTDSDTVTLWVNRKLPSTTPTESWQFGSWSDTTGWPHTATFFQQRLMVANTPTQPQTIWGSVSGDFENMRPDVFVEGANTVEDDNALDFTLAATKGAAIKWLVSARRLLAGTASGQWLIQSRGPVLTPTDFNAEEQTVEETGDVVPVKVGNTVLFVERAKQSVFDLGYNYEVDGLAAADLNLMSDHVAVDSDFAQIVYQRKPYSLVWVRKTNGELAVLTYKRDQNVVGWTEVNIGGTSVVVESIAVIPGSTTALNQVYDSDERDELWLSVKRTVNGGTVRDIEVMEGFYKGPVRAQYESRSSWLAAQLAAQVDAVYVDSAITYSGVSTATITGLSHLEGQSVVVFANGVKLGNETVSSGSITIDSAATKVQVGLNYDWTNRSLKLPYGSQRGSSVGKSKSAYAIVGTLLDAGVFQYGVDLDDGSTINFFDARRPDATSILFGSNELFTGEWTENIGEGFATDPRIWLKGSSPYPWTITGLGPEMNTNEQ